MTATPQLYSPRSYPFAFYWSTRKTGITPDDSVEAAMPGRDVWRRLAMIGYGVILCAAILSLLFVRRLPPRATIVLAGSLLQLIGHCWISWADPRHRYVAEAAFCMLACLARYVGQTFRFARARQT